MTGNAPLLVWLMLASLPFHRPTLLALLGPRAGLPELLFIPAAAVLAWKWRRAPPATAWVVWGLVLLSTLPSVIGSVAPVRSLTQWVLLGYVTTLFACGVIVASMGEPMRVRGLTALTAGASVASAIGLLGVAGDLVGLAETGLAYRYPWMGFIPRPLGPTESPAMLALIALGGWLAALSLRRRGRLAARLWYGLSGLFGLVLLFSQSRVLLAALAAAGVLLLLWKPLAQSREGAGWRWGRIVGGGLLVVAVVATLVSITWRLVPLRAAWPPVDTTLSPYRVCHEIAARAFMDHPLTGVGLEAFHRVWPRYYDPARHDPAYAGGAEAYRGVPRDPHGTWQGYAAEGGILALLGLLALALLAARQARSRSGGATELTAFLVALAVASLFSDVLTERSSWALLGLLIVPYEAGENDGSHTLADPNRV